MKQKTSFLGIGKPLSYFCVTFVSIKFFCDMVQHLFVQEIQALGLVNKWFRQDDVISHTTRIITEFL